MPEYAVGVDLGGTNLKVALVERERGLIREHQIATVAEGGPEHVMDRIAEAVRSLLSPGDERIIGIGIGSPGMISLDRRRVIRPPNLFGWIDVPLAAALEERLGYPVFLDNDANAAGLGSAFHGAGRPYASFIMVTLGTGVGGAIIHEKRLFRGANGGAGELGHVSVDHEGPYARSGVAGALEAYLGQQFLTRHARYRLLTRDTILHELAGPDLAGLTPRMLYDAASKGDAGAIEVFAWAGHKLGAGLGSVVNLLDIRKIVVGGGISGAGDFIMAPAREALRKFVIPGAAEGVELIRETLGNEVGLLGAAHLAFEGAGALQPGYTMHGPSSRYD
jgi:glucokinase